MSETNFTSGDWVFKPSSDLMKKIDPAAGYVITNNERICKVVNGRDGYVLAQSSAMYAAMQEFCDRVESGDVRSGKTYLKFMTLLSAARGETTKP